MVQDGVKLATPLFVVILLIGIVDIVFAVTMGLTPGFAYRVGARLLSSDRRRCGSMKWIQASANRYALPQIANIGQ